MPTANLNPQQLQAVRHGNGPLLVVAGAGSGKTRVITSRIAHLIREVGVDPTHILAITFTNKAAKEMRDRVHRMLGAPQASPWVSTFHSFCLRVLRQHIAALGYTNDFVIYDAQDQLALVKQCMKNAGINEDLFPPKSILGHISTFKNDFRLPAAIDIEELPYGVELKAAQIYPLYQDILKRNNGLDFDDLLLMTVRLFQESVPVLRQYSERFRHVLVDEFQDTNLVQYHLVRQLAGAHGNICVVGDDDQSIYRWRGANIANILNFERDFPGATVVKLEENYRSTQNILAAAGAVVRENVNRKEKTLWTRNPAGAPVTYYRAADELDEARFVGERILRYNREDGYSFNDMAVLYRTNAQSRVLDDELRRLGIPFRVFGGFRFYERKEVKDILSYMRVVLNPADSVSLQRIINVPPRGIGKTSLDKVLAWCAETGTPLLDGLRQTEAKRLITPAAGRKISEFVALLDGFKDVYEHSTHMDFLNEIIERTGYAGMLSLEQTEESRDRLGNIKELFTALSQFVEDGRGTLKDFLDSAALVSDLDNLEDERGILPLMTLHTCKGLEFKVVFIVGLENGLLPHASSMSDSEEYEEERRLCYVGFTRARVKLALCNARRRRIYGNTFTYQPSDFLSAIPAEVLDKEASAAARNFEAPAYRDDSGGQPSALPPPPAESGGGTYTVGAKVLHPKFGTGVIVNREGGESDLKLVVFFAKTGVGKKTLAVNHANLIPL